MSFWSRLQKIDMDLKKLMAVYLVIPFFGLAIPFGLYALVQSYSSYLALADRGVQTVATIQKVAETGGRKKRNAVTSTFRAADGRDYTSKAVYAHEGSRHLRPGMRIGVVYQRDLPSNNAPSLAYVRHDLGGIVSFLAIVTLGFSLLAWTYRQEYAGLFRSASPSCRSRAPFKEAATRYFKRPAAVRSGACRSASHRGLANASRAQ